MVTWTLWQLVYAVVGAFGTAAVHQHTRRDPRIGGVIGLLVGFMLGPFALVALWAWLYYRRQNVRMTTTTRRWYEWWRP